MIIASGGSSGVGSNIGYGGIIETYSQNTDQLQGIFIDFSSSLELVAGNGLKGQSELNAMSFINGGVEDFYAYTVGSGLVVWRWWWSWCFRWWWWWWLQWW